MREVVVANMMIEASFPDGTRDSIAVPLGCVPRVGEFVHAAGRMAVTGAPQLFKVTAVFYELGSDLEQFKTLLFLEPEWTAPGLRLISSA